MSYTRVLMKLHTQGEAKVILNRQYYFWNLYVTHDISYHDLNKRCLIVDILIYLQ